VNTRLPWTVLLAAVACAAACAGSEPRKQSWDVKPPAPQPSVAQAPAVPEKTADRLALLEPGCAAGKAGACVELGMMYEAGTGGLGRDPRRAFDGYARACTLGREEACGHIERLLGADDSTPSDLAAVEATFRGACERGTSEGCLGLATMHLQGIHVAESPEQARRLLARACDAKNGVACLRLGLILVAFPPDMDLEPGLRLLERGCALGTQLACVRSADRLLRTGWDRSTSWFSGADRALDRLRVACRAGEYAGCVAYAEAFLDGRGVPRDPARARDLLRTACDDGHARACEVLGTALLEAPDARGDAVRSWRRACQLRDGDACLRVAQTLHPLPGAPSAAAGASDLAAAVRLVQQACTLHSPEGCSTLAELHLRGVGVPRDARRAAELAAKACRLGAETGCEKAHLSRALR
jgi:TPR repeat protein